MIRRGVGFLMLVLLLGSTGLVARDGRAADPNPAAPGPVAPPEPRPVIESKAPVPVAVAVDPGPALEQGPARPGPPEERRPTPTRSPPSRASAPEPPRPKKEAPADSRRRIAGLLDALRAGTPIGSNPSSFKASITIDGQGREFRQRRGLPEGHAGPAQPRTRIPGPTGSRRSREDAAANDPARVPRRRPSPRRIAAIDREIRNAVRSRASRETQGPPGRRPGRASTACGGCGACPDSAAEGESSGASGRAGGCRRHAGIRHRGFGGVSGGSAPGFGGAWGEVCRDSVGPAGRWHAGFGGGRGDAGAAGLWWAGWRRWSGRYGGGGGGGGGGMPARASRARPDPGGVPVGATGCRRWGRVWHRRPGPLASSLWRPGPPWDRVLVEIGTTG